LIESISSIVVIHLTISAQLGLFFLIISQVLQA
jgi:hypothetical protein